MKLLPVFSERRIAVTLPLHFYKRYYSYLSQDLKKFDQKLAELRKKTNADDERNIGENEARRKSMGQFGLAIRLAIELIASLGGSVVFGWLIDRWAGTKPVFLLILLVIGMGAAALNIVKLIRNTKKQMKADE